MTQNDNHGHRLHSHASVLLCLNKCSGDRLYELDARYHIFVMRLCLRGTQEPNLSGYSAIKSSLMRSFSGPKIITGRV